MSCPSFRNPLRPMDGKKQLNSPGPADGKKQQNSPGPADGEKLRYPLRQTDRKTFRNPPRPGEREIIGDRLQALGKEKKVLTAAAGLRLCSEP